ncbi:MAG: uroporphyrinogen decarboxylase family protein [Anaerolineae bacterium]|jgi:uroporphyrinogen decarboxylase
MDHRERVLAAVNHEEPDRVPTALWGSAYGITDPLYSELVAYLDLGQPAAPFRVRRGHSVNRYDERVLEALETDTRYVWLGFDDLGGPPAAGGVDAWGVGWKRAGPYLAATEHPLAEATAEDLEDYVWPDVAPFIRRGELRRRARRLRERADHAVVGRAADSYGLLERASSLRGAQRFLLDLATDEAFADALIERVAAVLYRLLEITVDTAGPYLDILELPGDDYAGQHPLISPQMFDRFFAPRWRRLIELVKDAAPHCKVLFHSDGRMEPFLGRLIELGVDIFHCLEPMPEVDMARVKRDYGDRLCFWGGVDVKHALQGDVARVEREVRERISALGPGGGYVLAPANHLQPDVPPENVVALFEAARRYGTYPLGSTR